MVSSSETAHFTFTQLNKELHYRHGDTRTHLRRHSPLREVPSAVAAENGEGVLSLRNSSISEPTNVESVQVRGECARITLFYLIPQLGA